jgi:hypothetical protein
VQYLTILVIQIASPVTLQMHRLTTIQGSVPIAMPPVVGKELFSTIAVIPIVRHATAMLRLQDITPDNVQIAITQIVG